MSQNRIPVLAPDGEPLTPCRPARARQMIDEGRAVPFHNQGVFCIQLQDEPSSRETPYTACGIDPGSKAEGLSVKSTQGSYLHIQTEARSGISKKLKKRKNHRISRRVRNTPNRKPDRHQNRSLDGELPPSTKARWDWKLTICHWLSNIYPIDVFVVEDITESKGYKYNPLSRGKEYFYENLREIGNVRVVFPDNMASWRDSIEIEKSFNNKTKVGFFKHCIDSWMLAWLETNCPYEDTPQFTEVLSIQPIDIQRRVFPSKNSPSQCQTDFPLKRRALIRHDDFGVCYIGDHPNHPAYGALRSVHTGKLLSPLIDPSKCEFLRLIRWTWSEKTF